MNLIQIQEHLKDLPTQAIMSYANGQNPQVPPYMALGEMNRRKTMEQRAAQAPSSSVKEQLESELAQQVALPGVGQGMNMRINPAGMPPPVPSAQPQMAPKMPGMPVPPMAPKMPPQQMAQPGAIPAGAPGMAAGGLAELPVRKDIFNYAPGGIVAFADESNEQLVLPPGTPYDSKESGTYSEPQTSDKLPVGLANQILMKRLQGNVDLPEPVSRDQARAEVLAAKPELAPIIDKLPGQALTALAAKLEEQNTAQRDRFQQGEGRQGLAALSNALISAGEATRGQKGSGLGAAFGGFGKTYNAATQATEERAAKQQALERAQTIETMKLQADIEQMQRAFAEGRIDEAMKLKEQINARKAKIVEIQGAGAKETLDLEDKRQQRVIQEAQRLAQEARYKGQEAHEKRMYEQSKRSADKPSRFQEELALLRENPDLFNKMQGQSKSGTLTFEDAMNILRKDKLNTGKPLEDLAQMAQRMVNAAKLVQGGQSIPEAAKPPEDTRNPYQKMMPEFMGGKPAPTKTTAVPFSQLPK
jgi:hypothetical protein